jgi:hypothetical protein
MIASPELPYSAGTRTDKVKLSQASKAKDKGAEPEFNTRFLPSDFINRLIYVDGHPFSKGGGFESRPYLLPICDRNHKKLLLKCGRQVEKSTTLGNRLLTFHCLIPFFRSLFIAPTETQVRRFSMERITKTLLTSPGLKPIREAMTLDNVMHKEFPNNSSLMFGSVFHTPDRVRGVAADCIQLDEIQDIVSDHIPVIEETLSHSNPEYKYFWAAGTPKSMDNPIEVYWDRFSTQHEWTVPCERHTPLHWNVLGIKNVGLEGLICDKCGERINASSGKWQMLGNPKAEFHGYHISQLMVPWIQWSSIITRMKRYPVDKFYNEVLGLSYDSGTRPLSRKDLQKHCVPDMHYTYIQLVELQRRHQLRLFMGIDWGTGTDSFTVVTVVGYHPVHGRLTDLYSKKFIGEEADPVRQLELIKQMINDLEIERVGCDWGFGYYQNDSLMRTYGRQRVASYMYTAGQTRKVYWEPNLRRFMVNRTAVMSDIFNGIKRGAFHFFDEKYFLEEFGSDFLNIFAEYSERARMVLYNHPVGRPDDSFHSFLYAVLASMLSHPRPDILEPEADRG